MNNSEEKWENIKDYQGYQISNLGRVRSIDRYITGKDGKKKLYKGRYKKPTIGKRGYYVINLWKNNKQVQCYIHQLIGQTFIPNPENKTEIDHINRITTDNRIENLRWVTHKENMNNENTRKKMSDTHRQLYKKKVA